MATTSADTAASQAGNWIDASINGMNYRVLLPANYNPSVKYPTVLYLHQLDMGTDVPDLTNQVNGYFNTPSFRSAHPAIVVMPLLDQTADPSGNTINFGGVSTADTAGETNAIAALKQVMSQYSADPTKVYVTGNSLGGIGSWDMLIKYNAYTGTEGKIFAAGIPIAGNDYGQNQAQAAALLKNVPIWAYHGAQDTQVPKGWDEAMAQSLAGDPTFHYTEDPNGGHDVWDEYYTQSSTWNWLFQQSTTAAVAAPTSASTGSTAPVASLTVLTPTSGGSLTDSAGNAWTLTAAGDVDENGTAVPGGAGTEAVTISNGQIYAEDAGGTGWYTYSAANQSWTAASAPPSGSTSGGGTTTTPTPTTTGATGGGTTSTPTPTTTGATGTRDPSQIPFASDSIFNLPIGSGAQWTPNAQLASASIVINTDGNFNEPIYTGTASDPVVTVTNSAGATGGTPGTYQVHIPVGAQPSAGGDSSLTVDDTVTHQWASFGGFQWTSATTASATQGSSESDTGSGIQFDNSDQDEGVGTLRESDLQAGSINHMLRIELPDDMLKSVSSSAYQLAANAWPQLAEDGFGPSTYSGTVPFGVTIGIPASAVEPAAVKANAGADMLWRELQEHGAMIRDSGGSGNGVIFQTDQNVSANDPLIQGMEQFGSEIMSQVQILANQSPNSINGGGTPIVPLDPAPSGTTGSSTPSTPSTPSSPPTTSGGGSAPTGTQTVLTPTSGGKLTDAAGNSWTLTAAGNVDENGTAVPGGSGTEALTIANGLVYGEDAGGTGWYTYSAASQTWTSAAAPPVGATTTGSTPGASTGSGSTGSGSTGSGSPTVLTPTSGGQLKDAAGNVWTLTAAGNVDENGAAVPGGGGTEAVTIANGLVYAEDAGGTGWYTYSTASQTWTSTSAPPTGSTGTSSGGSTTSTGPFPAVEIPSGTASFSSSASNTLFSATAGNHTIFIGGSHDQLTATGGTETVTALLGHNTITTGAGNDTIKIAGSGNVVTAGAGTNTISDTGSGNTIVLPLGGGGLDIINGSVLHANDLIDLRAVLAATKWNGSNASLGTYLATRVSGSDTILSVKAAAGSTSHDVARFTGAGAVSLATLTQHAIL